jgi:hypothetical protein
LSRARLGHSSIHTTERYTHVAKRRTLSITSPFDTIDKEEEDAYISQIRDIYDGF